MGRKRHPGPGEVNVKKEGVWANDPDQTLEKGEALVRFPMYSVMRTNRETKEM